MAYEHTQVGHVHRLFLSLAGALAIGALLAPGLATLGLAAVSVLFLCLAGLMGRLRVSDGMDHVAVRFGPLPLLGTRVPYANIRSFRRARSLWIDGWGVHWVPGRGWTFNLWGFDCVELETRSGRVRIGTDDPAGLEALLRERVGGAAEATAA